MMMNNNKRKSIAIDMDGVMADVESQFMDWYERDYGVKIKRSAFSGIKEADAFPDKTAVSKFLWTQGFFRTLSVMPGSVEVIKKLMESFDVYIVSAAMEFPLSLAEKHAWLQEHFPFISWTNIIFCGDKSKIDTDFLIDDHCKNLDFCKGKAIMFSAGHNANQHHHTRVNNWEEVLAIFATNEVEAVPDLV